MRNIIIVSLILTCLAPATGLTAADNVWLAMTVAQQAETRSFADDYKKFIDVNRSELAVVRWLRDAAGQRNFRAFQPGDPAVAGDRFLVVNRDRTACLIVMGRRPLREGVRVIAAHIDSPHLTLKPNPLYDANRFALFQTNYHGGLKRYQWVNVPLALIGRIDRTDGTTQWIDLGLNADDPVFVIPDLAPHVDGDHRSRTSTQIVKAEEMDPIVGSLPDSTGTAVSAAVERFLKSEYNIGPKDFVSAELKLVPATRPRDVGVDRGMIGAYGHDDRACSYAAIRAIFNVTSPEFTTIAYLTENEEVGSINNTGARSDWFYGLIADLLAASENRDVPESLVRRTMARITVLSADVTTGVNPLHPGVQELTNACRVHGGLVIKLYGRGFNAHSEFTAHVRTLLDDAQVPWQTHLYKVGGGGGGTIGGFLSRRNMEVIDVGIPLLSMHSTWSILSKADLYQFYRGCLAFYNDSRPWPVLR